MPTLRTNILANYAGQVWMALMGVVFIPLYIKVLGMEAFGLVGLMLSIQALSMLFDLGMGGVLNRELARRAHDSRAAHTLDDLVRTFEWLVWPIALMIVTAVWLASSPLANRWLHPEQLSRAATAHAIAIMGLAVALQWPSSFYANGLSGLERQPALNLINAGFATLRGAGVLAVLYWVSPTISAFMWWYAAMGACQSLVSAATLWRMLPTNPQRRAAFRAEELRAAGRFAGGLVAIMALAVMLSQLDRIVISAMLPLAELGYFSLAMSIAAGMGRMIQPMFNALYPRYSRLVSLRQQESLTHLYHLSNQCLAVVAAAVAAVLIVFGRDVIYLWTGNPATAAKLALPLSILVAGTALNGLMNLPYALQLAHGWTRLAVGANLVALALGIPFCIWAVAHHGIVGAAWLWFATNLAFVTISIPLMHRRLLRGEMARWYVRDMLPPAIAAAACVLVVGKLLPALSRSYEGIFLLAMVSVATLLSAALAAPLVREMLRRQLGEWLASHR
ncbi:lipopolysaccharide biosynthesis protein [Rhodanobacter ginsengisoli]|uniref:Lipopolysaccharide biosynthesis protein n=1 Tax=Rhodanobacter ginsengisoli TaxID=418646 RepID=A0ABW0QNT3_9GAMM